MNDEERKKLRSVIRRSYKGEITQTEQTEVSRYCEEMFAKYPQEYNNIMRSVHAEVDANIRKYGRD